MNSKDASALVVGVLVALLALALVCASYSRENLSPVTGVVTDKKMYPLYQPVTIDTPWRYELIITRDGGQSGCSVEVSEDVYQAIVIGDRVQRRQPFVREDSK